MKEIHSGKMYSTDAASVAASDRYWDGTSWERNGRNTYLYKTKRGAYFLHHTTSWPGETERIEPIGEEEASEWYDKLPEHFFGYVEPSDDVVEEA